MGVVDLSGAVEVEAMAAVAAFVGLRRWARET